MDSPVPNDGTPQDDNPNSPQERLKSNPPYHPAGDTGRLAYPTGSGQGEDDHTKEGISADPPARVNSPEVEATGE